MTSVKLDKNDELLQAFEKTPQTRSHTNMGKLPVVKTAKTRHDPLQGVSSWRLLGELVKRHITDLQIAGFWLLFIGLVLYKARVI